MDKNRMLIDATHPEETRVVVLRGGRVEEFDYESANRKLLRGNIYLAKVTRVEPSLQAAFIDYGGNRHGFLAFNEIHPDYYQIPVADRQVLIDEEVQAEAEADAQADARAERSQARGRGEESPRGQASPAAEDEHTAEIPGFPSPEQPEEAAPAALAVERDAEESISAIAPASDIPEAAHAREQRDDSNGAAPAEANGEAPSDVPQPIGLVEEVGVTEVEGEAGENGQATDVEQVGSEDALEEVPERPRRRLRSYKIQEVIKRRQIILVQVVKEERGNKGAALTTYLSLAGRYTVLMPNTGRGGGISRKITNPQDRKRLKAIAQELEVPEGMGLIIRTAGASRTKQEIKRDFEYLLRLWENVRDLTLQSTAPSLVYEEGNLIKRSIRDLYSKDIEEILVAGDEAYKEAKEFMRMLMPSHAKNVIQYTEPEPLFSKFQIERQLNAMFSPYVTLRSGGYIVINQTEALVAIDVNSGKATREFSIEETALNTNLEAAEEIARQLKLRDLAGLIVVDFIDMEEKRNNRAVERRLKDCLRFDRARIQVGRISHFGLLEMSRQRLRTGVLEGSTSQCPHCQGTGIIRSTESVALAVLRALEDALMKDDKAPLTALTTASVALYILNNKRLFINEMEARYGTPIQVVASDRMQGANFAIEKASLPAEPQQRRPDRAVVNMEWGFEAEPETAEAENGGDDRRGSRRRRRRRGRRGERGEAVEPGTYAGGGPEPGEDEGPADEDLGEAEFEAVNGSEAREAGEAEAPAEEELEAEAPSGQLGEERRMRRDRRRGRRGGRRGREQGAYERAAAAEQPQPPYEGYGDEPRAADADLNPEIAGQDFEPPRQFEPELAAPAPAAAPVESFPEQDMAPRPPKAPEAAPAFGMEKARQEPASERTAEPVAEQAPEPVPAGPPRKGWWQRRFSS